MITALVTGSEGFLGRNLISRLGLLEGVDTIRVDVDTSQTEIEGALRRCDVIFHLAGVNRPSDPNEFQKVNRDFTQEMCAKLAELKRSPRIVFSSSIQAALESPYGASKRAAEEVLLRYAAETGGVVRIYRLQNLFGKWSRPNYNSVVATFCHNIANDLRIRISDPDAAVDLVYIDDVVEAFLGELAPGSPAASGRVGCEQIPSHTLKLGELAGLIQSFRAMRDTLLAPDFSVAFHRQLYATYLSYVPDKARETRLQVRRDERGSLAEFLKSKAAGQIFLSRTRPGVVRGNHYHHTKTEKFFVVEGEGLLKMRQIHSREVIEYRLCGKDYQVVDIPPGFTHSIQNVGESEMVTLFWASEIFDADRLDTYFMEVDDAAKA
jgi:UDP-2-acetamido-2,6-beta-L-arabino-hexul-4-ose reductase